MGSTPILSFQHIAGMLIHLVASNLIANRLLRRFMTAVRLSVRLLLGDASEIIEQRVDWR